MMFPGSKNRMSGLPVNEQEADLVRQAAAGGRAALEELLLAHYDRLAQRLIPKMPVDLRRSVCVEDVLQETFVEAAQRVAQFRPDGPDAFYAWLATIADHRLVDMVRALRAAKRGGGRAAVAANDWEASLTDLLGLLAMHERTPSRSLARREAVHTIQATLGMLHEDYGLALRLRYVEGLPMAEVGRRMGRTEAAVQMLCHRGLKQMRDLLGPDSEYLSRKA